MPPAAVVARWTQPSISPVVTPGTMRSSRSSRMLRVSWPARRIPSISSAVLSTIPARAGGAATGCGPLATRSAARWQRLYFLPLPHQQGSLRPSLRSAPGSLIRPL